MDKISLETITITSLKIIPTEGGKVLHAMKKDDKGFYGFGEAYFSSVDHESIHAWKKHTKMIMNLIVPVGKVRFVFHTKDSEKDIFRIEDIGQDNYQRITVPAGIWFGFKGISSSTSFILNLSNIKHQDNEVVRRSADSINFNWRA